ncbi:M56 family metallopeptidase [Paenibacillus allorhizosphaerae]|uniref:Protease HtpX n=1 Tax=Paenibacillus allorhizosphaerae TaxID=2849866 RepID=A0ABM8VPS3_9BACL|nr:M56 family metallopeptidase [Paenibacillus allorhizosphaerae]CAG7653291.1 Protease HtpX [Paenibacillus allorhizosphaerae]
MWNNRSKVMFASSVIVAGVILTQMGMYAMHMFFGWKLKFNLLQMCNNWMRSKGIFSVGHMLDALVVCTFVMCFALIIRQMLLERRARRKLIAAKHQEFSKQLNDTYGDGSHPLTVVRCERPVAFTMGFVTRDVYLTTGLLALLDAKEIEAVIHHERFHGRHGDPLKTFVLSLFASAFWYIPLMKWFHLQYKIARELLADQYAIGKMGSSAEIGSALLKLVKKGLPSGPMSFAHVSFADTSVNYRIRQILDPAEEAPLKLPLTVTMISVHIVLSLSILFLWALR